MEDGWPGPRRGRLVVKLAGQAYGPPWDEVDLDADPDWKWRAGAQDAPEEVYALWRSAVQRSRNVVAAVLQEGREAA